MTTPRDVYIAEWLDGVGYHAPTTDVGRLAHEAVRGLVGELGTTLWQLLPPGRDKSMVFTLLEDALMRANRALAINGGPREHITEGELRAIIVGTAADVAEDPRVSAEPLSLEPDTTAPRGYFLDGPGRRRRIPLDDAHLTDRMRGFRNSAGYVTGLTGSPLVWVPESPPAAPAGFVIPDDPGDASDWLDRANDAVNAKHPGAGYMPGPGSSVDGIRGHVPLTAAQAAEAERLMASVPPIDAATFGTMAGLTPAAAEVTPPAEPGWVADRAAGGEGSHTIWLPFGVNGDPVHLGVTQGEGWVGIATATRDRDLMNAVARDARPRDGLYGLGFRIDSRDQANLVLETLAAAAGRAFAEE